MVENLNFTNFSGVDVTIKGFQDSTNDHHRCSRIAGLPKSIRIFFCRTKAYQLYHSVLTVGVFDQSTARWFPM